MTADEAEHLPSRPAWRCSGCGRDWPCQSKRDKLIEEYADARVSLAVYLATCFQEAERDLPRTQPATLYHRFLGWLH